MCSSKLKVSIVGSNLSLLLKSQTRFMLTSKCMRRSNLFLVARFRIVKMLSNYLTFFGLRFFFCFFLNTSNILEALLNRKKNTTSSFFSVRLLVNKFEFIRMCKEVRKPPPFLFLFFCVRWVLWKALY